MIQGNDSQTEQRLSPNITFTKDEGKLAPNIQGILDQGIPQSNIDMVISLVQGDAASRREYFGSGNVNEVREKLWTMAVDLNKAAETVIWKGSLYTNDSPHTLGIINWMIYMIIFQFR